MRGVRREYSFQISYCQQSRENEKREEERGKKDGYAGYACLENEKEACDAPETLESGT